MAPPGPVLELCSGAGHIGLLAVTARAAVAGVRRRRPRRLLLPAPQRRRRRAAGSTSARAGWTRSCTRTSGSRWSSPTRPGCSTNDVARFPEDPVSAIDGGADGLELVRSCLASSTVISPWPAPLVLQTGRTRRTRWWSWSLATTAVGDRGAPAWSAAPSSGIDRVVRPESLGPELGRQQLVGAVAPRPGSPTCRIGRPRRPAGSCGARRRPRRAPRARRAAASARPGTARPRRGLLVTLPRPTSRAEPARGAALEVQARPGPEPDVGLQRRLVGDQRHADVAQRRPARARRRPRRARCSSRPSRPGSPSRSSPCAIRRDGSELVASKAARWPTAAPRSRRVSPNIDSALFCSRISTGAVVDVRAVLGPQTAGLHPAGEEVGVQPVRVADAVLVVLELHQRGLRPRSGAAGSPTSWGRPP